MVDYQDILQLMTDGDASFKWFDFRIHLAKPGYCEMQVTVKPEMCNGVGVAHGSIAFALADSCAAFAVNLYGRKALSVETSINQFRPAYEGNVLTCVSNEESLGKKLAVYTVEVTNEDGEKIALFKGIYYRSDKRWIEEAP